MHNNIRQVATLFQSFFLFRYPGYFQPASRFPPLPPAAKKPSRIVTLVSKGISKAYISTMKSLTPFIAESKRNSDIILDDGSLLGTILVA